MLSRVSFIKKLLSKLYPVRIKHADGMNNTQLELFLYRGQWQLGTRNALYSDGWRYRPMKSAFKSLKNTLPGVTKVLVLGVGLGSAVMMLGRRRIYPDVTLVDHDQTSLEWAIELFDHETQQRVSPVCADANAYMRQNKQKYDLVIVDIFNERVVPDFVLKKDFLQECRNSIAAGGNVVINYIENKDGDWKNVQQTINAIFPENKVAQFGLNKVVTASGISGPPVSS